MSNLPYFFIALSICLQGCTATGPNHIVNADAFTAGNGNGLIVGSFSRTPGIPKYNNYDFSYREISTKKTGSISATKSQINLGEEPFKDDFQEADSEGAIFSIELPPGKYEFFQYWLYSGNGYVENSWYSPEDFSIQFEVIPGGIIYVGELLLTPTMTKSTFGLTVPTGGSWSLRNRSDRDLPLLKKLYPNLPWASITYLRPNGCTSIYEC